MFFQSQGANSTTQIVLDATQNGGTAQITTGGPILFSGSTISLSTNQVRAVNLSTSLTTLSTLTFTGISTVSFQTNSNTGTNGQTAGRLVMSGCDLDLGQNDLWVQQVRVGAGNPGGSAQTEVIFYSPDAATVRGFGIGGLDRAIRTVSTINGGTGGYVLDTAINAPFYSTLGGVSSVLMSWFPSTNLSTIGVSTLTNITPPGYFVSAYNSTSQTVAGANVSTVANYNATAVNVGGFTVNTSNIVVPVAGTYENLVSFQFDTTSGGTNAVEFWMTKNGAALAQTNSKVSITNNGDTIGTVSIFDTAAAGDAYGWMFYSADANMAITATAAGATPAIPSVIFNIKRLG